MYSGNAKKKGEGYSPTAETESRILGEKKSVGTSPTKGTLWIERRKGNIQSGRCSRQHARERGCNGHRESEMQAWFRSKGGKGYDLAGFLRVKKKVLVDDGKEKEG